MSTDSAAFLAALQLGDSALPIGRFVHSYGLETWFADNDTAGVDAIRELIEAVLCSSAGPLDGAAVALAARASSVDALCDLDDAVTAHKLTLAARHASTSCGRQLARTASQWATSGVAPAYCQAVMDDRTPGNLGVVEGAVGRSLGIAASSLVLLELRGFAAALLAAAIRLGRMSPVRGQAVLHELGPSLIAAAEVAVTLDGDSLRTTGPHLEICTMRHRLADARMFST